MFEKTLAFFVVGGLTVAASLAINLDLTYSVLIGCIGGSIAVVMLRYLQGDYSNPNSQREYKYKFQQHPSDDWHFVIFKARTQDEADELARVFFSNLAARDVILMRNFYRAV